MAFNIDYFKSQSVLQDGTLRTNAYTLYVPPIPGLFEGANPRWSNLKTAADRIALACDSTNFPGTGIELNQLKRLGYGPIERKPVFPVFTNLQCTFYTDIAATVYRFFHEWMRLTCNNYYSLNGPMTTRGGLVMDEYELSYKPEYAVDINLRMYTPDGICPYSVWFRQAYPVMIPDVRFAWGELNEIVKVPVVFTFMDWYAEEQQAIIPFEK